MYHVYRLHTSHHHCSHSLTGEAHIDTIIVNERAAAALVLVGRQLLELGPAKCCLITTSSEEVTVYGVVLN